MQTTANLALRKPEGTDVVNVDDFNYNADIIDTEIVKKASSSVDGRMAKEDKVKLDGVSNGANKVEQSTTNGNIKIDSVEKTVYLHPGSGTNPHGTTKTDIGLPNVTNDAQVKRTEMGAVSGVATLDASGVNAQAPKVHTHTKSQITDFPTSLPASGGSADTAAKLATARTISLTSDVTGSASFDGSGNISIAATVVDDSHNHVIANIDNLQSNLDSKTPFATLSATTPATAGWYRIATSAVNIGANSGLFKVDFSGSGVLGSALFRASCHNGAAVGSAINQLGFTTTAGTLGLTQVRVVYNTTASSNYAYVEVYNPTALAITYAVDVIDATGWSLVAPNTTGSIPSGYTSESLTFDTGFVSAEDVVATRQLKSNIANGTAPIVVISATKVANLNADKLDDQEGTYYLAWANLTGKPTTLSGYGITDAATSVQGAKADAALPAAGYTAADVLAKLKTVDGSGSGLDAATVNGKTASATPSTTEKTDIIGMVNELFNNANNGKSSVASAIGSPTIATETFAQIATDINSRKSTLATNLTNKGQSASASDTLSNLVAKVANIARGQGVAVENQVLQGITFSNSDGTLRTGTATIESLGGKMWASGSTYLNGTVLLQIAGLSFTPKFITTYSRFIPYGNNYYLGFNCLYTSGISHVNDLNLRNGSMLYTSGSGTPSGYFDTNVFTSVVEGGFEVDALKWAYSQDIPVYWFASE